jgi:uncharacterized protein (UPF0276 family)
MTVSVPHLGHGVGLRTQHFPCLWEGTARVDWFEAITENFMVRGGRPLAALEKAREVAPLVLHGVSLSLGSMDPLNESYLDDLQTLIHRFEPAWVSDHLCWGSIGGHYAHDLLPLPYTEEAIEFVVNKIQRVQEKLGRQILVENVSSYLTYIHSTIPEWEFLSEIARRADCGILLDVNNIYVNAFNHHFDPKTYIAQVPHDRVGQIHLAGHSDKDAYLFDTHDGPVIDQVWELYRVALRHCGRVSTLVEWDDQIPEFQVVCAEAECARRIEAEEIGLVYAQSA